LGAYFRALKTLLVDICDVVNEFGARTGRAVTRGPVLAPGEFYWVIHVWIRDETGAYLVQQRAPDRPSDPGIWATTVGYVLASEDSLAAAIRETSEEMGIQLSPAQLSRLDRLKTENRIEDLWLASVSRKSVGTPRLGSEVGDWKCASKVELARMIHQGDFFAYSYFGKILA
jgi:8-oxo-dGTP diphosphatase